MHYLFLFFLINWNITVLHDILYYFSVSSSLPLSVSKCQKFILSSFQSVLFYFIFLSTHFPRVSFTGYFVSSSSLSVFCISLCFLLSPPPAFHPFRLLSCCSFYLIPPVMDSRIIPPLKVERWSYFAFKVIFYQNKKRKEKEMEQRERWLSIFLNETSHCHQNGRGHKMWSMRKRVMKWQGEKGEGHCFLLTAGYCGIFRVCSDNEIIHSAIRLQQITFTVMQLQ